MKRAGVTFAIAALLATSFAEMMVVHLKDGATERIPVTDITEMGFEERVGVSSQPPAAPIAHGVKLSAPAGKLTLILAKRSSITIELFDARGRVVRSMPVGIRGHGFHRFNLSAFVAGAARGVQFVRVRIGADVFIERLVRL
jgi:hypothetical protein